MDQTALHILRSRETSFICDYAIRLHQLAHATHVHIRSFYSVIVSRIITWWRWHRRCHTYTRRIICKPKSSLLSLTQSCISKAEDSLMGFHWPSRTQLILGCLKTRSSIIMANGFSRIITQVLRAQSDSWIVCDSDNWNGMSIAFFNIKIEKKIIVCGIRSTV